MTVRPAVRPLPVLAALFLAACGATPDPSAFPAPPSVSTFTAPPSDLPPAAPIADGCPPFAVDPTASQPPFTTDTIEPGTSDRVATTLLGALERLYAGEPQDAACDVFTAAGLRTLAQADPRARLAFTGEQTLGSKLLLRTAGEGATDLFATPPTLPLEIIFDILAGSRTTDHPSGTSTTSSGPVRIGLDATFRYDGRRWLADAVAAMPAEEFQWAALPEPVPLGEPCTGFGRDPAGTAFDEGAGVPHGSLSVDTARTWCDANGRGRIVRQPDLIVMHTRYPCGSGHIAAISLGNPQGTPIDTTDFHDYLRDPRGHAFDEHWIAERWRASAELPADAASTGWTNGNIELYVSPSRYERGVYVRLGDRFEWWPRGDPRGWGVIDCN